MLGFSLNTGNLSYCDGGRSDVSNMKDKKKKIKESERKKVRGKSSDKTKYNKNEKSVHCRERLLHTVYFLIVIEVNLFFFFFCITLSSNVGSWLPSFFFFSERRWQRRCRHEVQLSSFLDQVHAREKKSFFFLH